jgi:hypothetical protein
VGAWPLPSALSRGLVPSNLRVQRTRSSASAHRLIARPDARSVRRAGHRSRLPKRVSQHAPFLRDRPARRYHPNEEHDMAKKRVWLVTGAGRGLGVDIARAVLAKGHAVVATGRDAAEHRP